MLIIKIVKIILTAKAITDYSFYQVSSNIIPILAITFESTG